jgi:hypothetical protein
MTRKLRRRLRIIAARATLCALVFAALSSVGYRQALDPEAAPVQAALLTR